MPKGVTRRFPRQGPTLHDLKAALDVFNTARAGSDKPSGYLRGIRAVIVHWESRPSADNVQEDVARLDWLIEQDNCVVFEAVNGFCLCWIDEHDPRQSEYQIGTFPTARAAIDAARAAQEGK